MKRFIDLRGQIIPDDHEYVQFAFFDTVTGTFGTFSGEQVFDSLADFRSCATGAQFDRCEKLIPEWVK